MESRIWTRQSEVIMAKECRKKMWIEGRRGKVIIISSWLMWSCCPAEENDEVKNKPRKNEKGRKGKGGNWEVIDGASGSKFCGTFFAGMEMGKSLFQLQIILIPIHSHSFPQSSRLLCPPILPIPNPVFETFWAAANTKERENRREGLNAFGWFSAFPPLHSSAAGLFLPFISPRPIHLGPVKSTLFVIKIIVFVESENWK